MNGNCVDICACPDATLKSGAAIVGWRGTDGTQVLMIGRMKVGGGGGGSGTGTGTGMLTGCAVCFSCVRTGADSFEASRSRVGGRNPETTLERVSPYVTCPPNFTKSVHQKIVGVLSMSEDEGCELGVGGGSLMRMNSIWNWEEEMNTQQNLRRSTLAVPRRPRIDIYINVSSRLKYCCSSEV